MKRLSRMVVLSMVAAFMLVAAPQQANAQFLKNLGKTLKNAGEEVLENAKKVVAQPETTMAHPATTSAEVAKQSAVVKETTVDDNNLNLLGISLGQPKDTLVKAFAAKGFKTVKLEYDDQRTRGDYYGKLANLTIDEYKGKAIVEMMDVKSYTLNQAKQRLDQLKKQLQGDELEEIMAGDGMDGYRFMQKGGKIELYYYNEDEMDGASDHYIVVTKFYNQDFSE